MTLTNGHGNTIIDRLCVLRLCRLISSSLTASSLCMTGRSWRASCPLPGCCAWLRVCKAVDGNLDYGIEGDVDRQDRPLLRLRVSGVVQLQCQRCLDGFEHEINIETALRLVAPEALDTEYDDNPDEPDCIASSAELDLAALIEDEVLLALPAYPRHEPGQVSGPSRAGDAGVASAKFWHSAR